MYKSLAVSLLLGSASANVAVNLSRCTKADGCKAEKNYVSLDNSWGCGGDCNYADYGMTSSGDGLALKLVNPKSVGSRSYMTNGSDDNYTTFKILNQEFTFDVDPSQMVCGLNSALYFVEMDPDGGNK